MASQLVARIVRVQGIGDVQVRYAGEIGTVLIDVNVQLIPADAPGIVDVPCSWCFFDESSHLIGELTHCCHVGETGANDSDFYRVFRWAKLQLRWNDASTVDGFQTTRFVPVRSKN